MVLNEYPDTVVRVAGGIKVDLSFGRKMLLPGYYNYLTQQIRHLHLNNNISFIGTLNGEEMKQEYLSSNLFLCPSSIENSPNSLCEAQILGVPVLAANVGGIPDLMKGDESHLYRFEDVELLAKMICDVFQSSLNYYNKSERDRALDRHDKKTNIEKLYSIYDSVRNE